MKPASSLLVSDFLKNGLNVTENVSLANYSTMRVGGIGKILVQVQNTNDLKTAILIAQAHSQPIYLLGSGSNTLFKDAFDGVIIKIETKGVTILEEDDHSILFSVAAGEDWHEFVEFCVSKNLTGNENLAYIPGTVGAAPVQNIAAYGQVQEDTLESVTAIQIASGDTHIFTKEECEFSYRSSIFKEKLKQQYCITSVQYRLIKAITYNPETSYHSRYESLQQFLPKQNEPLHPKDIFNAIISLRKHKLPQVDETGTLGSFFMNPFITTDHLRTLQIAFPNIQYYPVDKMQYPKNSTLNLNDVELVKIPAGWLLEELGFRGTFNKNVGSSPKQALCIVVTGPATGSEVLAFAKKIQKTVQQKTQINLKTEVNIVGKQGLEEL